jgi:hypothetical protein
LGNFTVPEIVGVGANGTSGKGRSKYSKLVGSPGKPDLTLSGFAELRIVPKSE